jgi:hypothetical protein
MAFKKIPIETKVAALKKALKLKLPKRLAFQKKPCTMVTIKSLNLFLLYSRENPW